MPCRPKMKWLYKPSVLYFKSISLNSFSSNLGIHISIVSRYSKAAEIAYKIHQIVSVKNILQPKRKSLKFPIRLRIQLLKIRPSQKMRKFRMNRKVIWVLCSGFTFPKLKSRAILSNRWQALPSCNDSLQSTTGGISRQILRFLSPSKISQWRTKLLKSEGR